MCAPYEEAAQRRVGRGSVVFPSGSDIGVSFVDWLGFDQLVVVMVEKHANRDTLGRETA